MIIKIQQKNQSVIWVSIEELNIYSETKNIIEHTGDYVCYFKLSEHPNPVTIGEIIKDENNQPLLFKSPQEAIKYIENKITIS